MQRTPGALVDGRYELVDRLGDGAMGQVWRARDTRFESRLVAIKFLREDETIADDAERRERLAARLSGASRPLDSAAAVEMLASALGGRDLAQLEARVRERLGPAAPNSESVLALFDEFVTDPALNENARLRAKLRRLFRDEANSVANLRHDNIVSIFDYGEYEATPYLVMDYIEGRTLHQILDQKLTLSLTRKLQLIEDLCAGLSHAHSRQLVHRDIKPANLIIDQTSGNLKILDFGVVRRLGTHSTVGIAIGTFCYMSPEQTRGAANLDQRSDIFAVGLVLYELLTGQKAFPPGRNVADLVMRIQREPPPPVASLTPGVPARLQAVVDKALAKRPEDRYQDLREMQRDLERVRLDAARDDRAAATVMMPSADMAATIVTAARPDANQLRPPFNVPTFSPAAVAPTPPVVAPAEPTPVVVPAAVPVKPADVVVAKPRPDLSRYVVPVMIVAASVLLVVVSVLLWQRMSGAPGEVAPPEGTAAAVPESPDPAPAAPPVAEAVETPPEPAAALGLNTVTIDVRPWARVRIVAARDGQAPPDVPAEALYAPFTIDLAPGEYTLEAENDGLNRAATFQIRVESGKPQYIVRMMPGFNATKVVDALLAQD